ncbi:uncharacterized protein EI97DRAFT_164563 [Westerdykella ornata]|uniref:GPI anchored serine-threonine rich protein n=1 Tax=Westerdykella ornata TaxID=318751 RepID=A0A6A6JDF4_WESOR|nr:uncharacterized protein EI97DRAFT_164563 [Westerdykella ornata]KAF2273219.1 hypothetical protein EI97DRAFT_164563 [Westerdykella ornata]
MRLAAVTLLASAAFVAAQSKCDAQNILDACKVQYQNRINACKPNDYICYCEEYTNLDTCYNNCPNSDERPPVKNQVTQYCLAAEPLKSASSASAATASKTQTGSSESTATTAPSTTGTDAPTGTGSATGTQKTGAADSLFVPAGGALAAALALAGLL